MKLHNLLPLLFLGLLTACVDQEFDAPPVDGEDPGLTANTTIAELKALHPFDESITPIGDDVIIKGTVIADDRSGNLYRTFIMQDETAGIQVLINLTNNYIYYPVGREIFIDASGLFLSDYRGVLQLGGYVTTENGSESLGDVLDLTNTIFPGKQSDGVVPTEKSIGALNDDDVNTLVQLTDVQFAPLDRGQPFADAVGRSSLNRELQSCDGEAIVIRTSGFADFAASLTPQGSGSVTAVYTVFNTTKQLLLRDTSDIVFTDELCGQGNPEDFISIGDVRDLYSGSLTAVPASKHIKGIVTSDVANANLTNRNLFLQEPGGAGIAIRFDGTHDFPLGMELDINVGGMELSEFNGLLQINNVPLGRVLPTGSGSIDPQVVTLEDLLDSFDEYEGELVRVNGVTLNGDDYAFDTEVTDGNESIVLFGTTYSTFANTTVASNEVDLIAIVSQGGNDAVPQLIIRNLDDVVGGDHGGGGGGGGNNGPGDPVDEINEDFQSLSNNEDIFLPGWTNVAAEGTRIWRAREFDGNVYAQATAYNDTAPSMVTWLISPPVTELGEKTLRFNSAVAFYTHNGLDVLVSTDYDGTNLDTATWTELDDLTLAGQAQENYTFVDSGEIDLSDYVDGTGFVAFRYTGNGGGQTASYILDDVVVE